MVITYFVGTGTFETMLEEVTLHKIMAVISSAEFREIYK